MMKRLKKLFLALLIIVFSSSSCLVIYQDYPRRRNIRYRHIHIWGGWYDYYWSSLWYYYRHMRYNRSYRRGRNTVYKVNKGSLKKPDSDSSKAKKVVRGDEAGKKNNSAPKKGKKASKSNKVKKK